MTSTTRPRNSSSRGWLAYIPITIELLTRRFNGLISMGSGEDFEWSGNLDGQYLHFTAPSTPDTSIEIPHGLERAPVGYVVVRQTAAGTLYDPSDATGWSDSTITWKCNVASVTFTVLVF